MRIYVSVDMEGITGVAVGKQVQPGEKDYDRFRRLMTQDANAAFFVGYHQREGGGDGILNHTLIGRIVYEVRINGEPADEALINAGLAGAFGVPVALVTGDSAVCAEAERRLPGVVTAPVKEALDRYVGLSLAPGR